MDDTGNVVERSPEAIAAGQRFAHLPAGLCDLAHLACGLRNATEGVPYRERNPGAPGESVSDRERDGAEAEADGPRNGTDSVSCSEQNGNKGAFESARNDTEADSYREPNGKDAAVKSARNATATAVSTLFERRCAEAFRCLGFEVRQLGQGCGRAADCLAVATSERFAVIIDAKVRRKGYTLGTDDRQFCEYATRHCRELAQSGIERVYFAVIGHGFRQADLEKLAGYMTGTPIRSVVFIEAEALMRLVDQSISKRREFRLADIDQLLFGNKILAG